MRRACLPFVFCALAALPQLKAGTVTVDFEGYFDQTPVTVQYPGLIFANSSILLAGATLNELEAPPHGGNGVGVDCASFDSDANCLSGGPIVINFLTPVSAFSGYFTYFAPLTVTGYDQSNNALPGVNSAFSSNFASSGNPTNELLTVTYAPGLSRITISGSPEGFSFVMDDLSLTTIEGETTAPEPSTTVAMAAGLALLVGFPAIRRRRLAR
jgi:MYXO-CTERM domain-containing protein